MIIDLIINDKRINVNQVKYVAKNFEFISEYEIFFRVNKVAKFNQNKAGFYIVYGNQKTIHFSGKYILIPYIHFEGQKETYSFLASEVDYIGNSINKYLPILTYTCQDDIIQLRQKLTSIHINVDLIWNIFFHMSLYREYLYEKKFGELGSSFCKLSVPEKVIRVPVANCLISILENLINSLWGKELRKKVHKKFQVLLTHDVDALQKTMLIRSKQAAFLLYNAINFYRRLKIKKGSKYVKKAFKMLLYPANYYLLDTILKMDQQYAVTSIFFIYAKVQKNFKRWKHYFFNPQYNLENLKACKKFDNLKRESIIGLHGSYESFDRADFLRLEKAALEDLVGKVKWNRNHWLRFSVQQTCSVLEKNGIQYDSTLGFNDQVGFRSGLCTPYFLYNFAAEKAYNIVEYPLNIMDSTLYNYLRLTCQEALYICKPIINWVIKYKGVLVLNWHNRVYSKDFNWHQILKELLREAKL